MELVKNGVVADLMQAGTIVKTAFCGPCFGAGDTPANGAFSIRHSTRNFPNREGSKLQSGQIASVALMDARSIAATAANPAIVPAVVKVLVKLKPFSSQNIPFTKFFALFKPILPISSQDNSALPYNLNNPITCFLMCQLLLQLSADTHF